MSQNSDTATLPVDERRRPAAGGESARNDPGTGTFAMNSAPLVEVSVVIPVFNEEGNLPTLFQRLYPVMDQLGRSYEILFTNDGSSDRSRELLAVQYEARPDVTRVIEFSAN